MTFQGVNDLNSECHLYTKLPYLAPIRNSSVLEILPDEHREARKTCLPRTTERPVHERRDEPRTIVAGVGVEIVRGSSLRSCTGRSVVRGIQLFAVIRCPSGEISWAD